MFLLALCFSISLEVIERFFSTPGPFDLILLLTDAHSLSLFDRNFQSPSCSHSRDFRTGFQHRRAFPLSWFVISSYLPLYPQLLVAEHGHSHDGLSSKAASITSPSVEQISGDVTPRQTKAIPVRARSRSDSYTSLYGHPAATRASLVQAANDIAHKARSPSPTSRRRDQRNRYSESDTLDVFPENANEQTPLLAQQDGAVTPTGLEHSHPSTTASSVHGAHAHTHAGSMNMRALVLHVMGDALGNVGVIATGLIIWLTEWKFKYYFDPVISLVITVIIFSSALPLGELYTI